MEVTYSNSWWMAAAPPSFFSISPPPPPPLPNLNSSAAAASDIQTHQKHLYHHPLPSPPTPPFSHSFHHPLPHFQFFHHNSPPAPSFHDNKEPFWRPLDTDYINLNNNKPFSELEAIYKPGNQTGSGSALTGDVVPESDVDATPPTPRGRRKRRAERTDAIAEFFHRLVKRVMDRQESLHGKLLEFVERRERERAVREEAWRKEAAVAASKEAASRAHEAALADSREAAILSFLEKITGESLDLPPGQHSGSGRWPKAEVMSLIRIRSGLEGRFQEPGPKGPLWEEVSGAMAAAGHDRCAKRCKEKWENINKYFRKTKDSGKKRPQQSKTCPYFHLLDQLYSYSGDRHDNANSVGEVV